MSTDVYLDLLLQRWEAASAALARAEARDLYSDEVDELADEVIAARVALSEAGVRDIEALASGQRERLIAQATVLENALR
jgi:hypothetical protein